MHLILLSGGSGQRLWPLSNDARSKQFLHLLASPEGGTESMIQRVVRQIRQTQLTPNITLATHTQQRDSIINQLGADVVNIVTEPERRDTFPAIALATTYLARVKHCPENEVVVVMPCDVYTEEAYFHTIRRMAQAVADEEAQLVLMGVAPGQPKEEFGYVLPQASDAGREVQRVVRFIEKPDAERAQHLLQEGAYWNGGVFAFKLGYLLQIVSHYAPTTSYEALQTHYCNLPKISFDYEVAEKAESVAMVPFRGRWKDLGTWNALCEELPSTHIGNVKMGNHTENTHVVNELGIPVFCDGLTNAVVAASPDGIMVCGKAESEQVKDYVNELHARPMYEERRWGTYRVLDNVTYPDGLQSLTKSITLKAGKNISYQIHHHRSEVWTIVDGEGIFLLNGEQRPVTRGDVLVIRQEQHHAIRAVTDLVFIEVQMGNPLIEEDIERFDWQWQE